MQLEIEQKFAVIDGAGFRSRLAELSPSYVGQARQQDTYYNHPCRDFANTDEALRIRSTDTGTVLTYKGPKHDAVVKTRPEIELPLAEAAAWPGLLVALGFREVATVSKCRDRYHLARSPFDVEIALDEVEGLGSFVEIEIVADESQVEAAQREVTTLCSALGLEQAERRSYLRMLLEKRSSAAAR